MMFTHIHSFVSACSDLISNMNMIDGIIRKDTIVGDPLLVAQLGTHGTTFTCNIKQTSINYNLDAGFFELLPAMKSCIFLNCSFVIPL